MTKGRLKRALVAVLFGPQPSTIALVGLVLYTLIYELSHGYAAYLDEDSSRWQWFFLGGMVFAGLAQIRQHYRRG